MEPLDKVDPFELVQFHFATVQSLVPHHRCRWAQGLEFWFIPENQWGLANYLLLECATIQWLFESAPAKADNIRLLNLSGVPSSNYYGQVPYWWGDEVQPTAEGSLHAIPKDQLNTFG